MSYTKCCMLSLSVSCVYSMICCDGSTACDVRHVVLSVDDTSSTLFCFRNSVPQNLLVAKFARLAATATFLAQRFHLVGDWNPTACH